MAKHDEEIAELKEQLAAETKRRAAVETELTKSRQSPSVPSFVASPQRADLATFKDGSFKKRGGDEVFQLRKIPLEKAETGRTHQLANSEHFVELTEDEFRIQFDAEKGEK